MAKGGDTIDYTTGTSGHTQEYIVPTLKAIFVYMYK